MVESDGEPWLSMMVPARITSDCMSFDPHIEAVAADYESDDESGNLSIDGVIYKHRESESYQFSAARECMLRRIR